MIKDYTVESQMNARRAWQLLSAAEQQAVIEAQNAAQAAQEPPADPVIPEA